MKKLILILFLLISINWITSTPYEKNWTHRRQKLEKVVKLGKYRFFYTEKGYDKFPKRLKKDKNQNQIFDVFENVKTYLDACEAVYQKVLKLETPFSTKKIRYIDVNFVKNPMFNKKDYRILSYNKVFNFKRYVEKKAFKVMTIDISNSIKKLNHDLSKEIFKLYCSGYSKFNDEWLVEGLADYSKYILKKGSGPYYKKRIDIKKLDKLIMKKSNYTKIFKELAKLYNPQLVVSELKKLDFKDLDNKKLIEDNILYGKDFIKKLLQELKYYSRNKQVNKNMTFNLILIKKAINNVFVKAGKEKIFN